MKIDKNSLDYAKNITSDDGTLKMWKGHKLNIVLLPKKTKIRVRNCSHLGKTELVLIDLSISLNMKDK